MKIELKSGYFVGEKLFENRKDAEEYVKIEEVSEFLKGRGVEDCRYVSECLCRRYEMEERYDYTDPSQQDDSAEQVEP